MVIPKSGAQAIKALLALAEAPSSWRSVNHLASSLDLPAPMLEQLMLRLRRAGVVEARRGRRGGYRLAQPPMRIPLLGVLRAASGDLPGADPGASGADPGPMAWPEPLAEEAGPMASRASDRVTELLRARLRRALLQELERLTLEDLLFDLRSARAELSNEGGLLLG
jgi:Rrf2 family protein